MLHSQSNRSLQSGGTDGSDSVKVSMSREEALSLLQSESLKTLHESTRNTRSGTRTDADDKGGDRGDDESVADEASDQFTFTKLPKGNAPPSQNTKHSSSSTSDDDSNDSILDWLDEPRASALKKRLPLLPPQSQPQHTDTAAAADEVRSAPTEPPTKAAVAAVTEKEQWREWLSLSTEDLTEQSVVDLVERAAEMQLPTDWEKVNDNLYHNIRTDERRMSHPLLEEMRTELEALRRDQKNAEPASKVPSPSKPTQTLKSTLTLKSTQSTSLSSLTVNTQTPNIPPRQIDSAARAHSSSATAHHMDVPVVAAVAAPRNAVHSAKTQISVTSERRERERDNAAEVDHKQEAESLILQNLRMELSETRTTLSRLMNDKTRLMEEAEEMHCKTEILLNEQRQRLTQSHSIEMKQLQGEVADLRALNSKMLTDHQAELVALESSIRAGESKQKQRTLQQLTLSEQRGRDELSHQMELHRQTVDELKAVHQNEISMLQSMHQRQLSALRTQNKSEGQLDLLVTKMESSTQSLHRLQKDLVLDREHTQSERESKMDQKERILSEKDEELLLERKAHRKLLERFQALVEETKIEKSRIRETEDAVKRREEQLARDMVDGNRELNLQRDVVNEERRKCQLQQSRWEKLKQDDMAEIHRLKSEHTESVQSFYEEQEMERARLSKQRQIMAEDKTRFLASKQRLEAEREALDEKLLAVEAKGHSLEMERAAFDRKVQDVAAMSRRVHQQSELVTKMYTESKTLEEDNAAMQIQLMSQSKQLKVMKQELLMEKQHVEQQRAVLEQDQLSLLTTKREMMQHMDSMKAMEQQTQSMVLRQRTHENAMELANEQPAAYRKRPRSSWNSNSNRQSMNRIQSELRELKEFVNECTLNISAHRDDVRHLRLKRESYRDSPTFTASAKNNGRFNALKMNFPSFSSSKSGSFVTAAHSVQSSRSRASLKLRTAKLSSSRSGKMEKKNSLEAEWGRTSSKANPDATINDLSEIDVSGGTRTPVLVGQSRNHLNTLNVTDNTLSGTFVSMANIDTPITIDNRAKTRKRVDKILEDSTMPMTPTQMPNLSEIDVTELDNGDDAASVEDGGHDEPDNAVVS